MIDSHPLFDLSGSYLEIDGWVIIDLNRETGSIYMYEYYELSAESFLAEVNTLPILPSLRMPFPSMASSRELQSKETISDQAKSSMKGVEADKGIKKEQDLQSGSTTDTNRCIRPRADSDLEPLSPRQKREQRWAEIRRVLTASLDEDDANEEDPAKDNSGSENEADTPKSVYFDIDDSYGREGSDSPHTDPDFVHSSSDSTDVEWVLGTGMVGLKVGDSFFMVESTGTNSVTGVFDAMDKKAGGESNEGDEAIEGKKRRGNASGQIEGVSTDDKEVNGKGEDLENGNSRQRDQHRKESRNISLAAGATAAMVAAIWMLERKYDLS